MKNISTLLVFLGSGVTSALESKSMTKALSDSYLKEESLILDKGEILKKGPLSVAQPKPDLSHKVMVSNNTQKFVQK